MEVNILLVEDNHGDARLIKEFLKTLKIRNFVHHIDRGDEVLPYLKETRTIPHLILLDLNLPGETGQEILQELKEDSVLRDIPICILTASNAESDILKTYHLHANCYIVKPLDLDQFFDIMNSITNFWLQVVTLPTPI